MSADEDDYGEFADEDFIEALSQASQTLPEHPQSRRASRDGTDSGDEEGNGKSKKKKYKIHEGLNEVPKASMCLFEDYSQLHTKTTQLFLEPHKQKVLTRIQALIELEVLSTRSHGQSPPSLPNLQSLLQHLILLHRRHN